MSILANNIYNLSLIALGNSGQSDQPFPGDVDFNSFDPEALAIMEDLLMERFGRSCHEHLRESGGGINRLVAVLESLPQVATPKTLLSFKESDDPRSGLVLFYPGKHGMARSFQNFASLIDGPNTVLACEYDGIDRASRPARTVKETIENMYRELLAGHADLLRRLEASRREVVLFGFCLGSCYAHAMARRLSRDHDLAIRMVFFDGHPAEWFSGTSPRELLRTSKKALSIVRRRGRLERRLVRQGRRQHHMLSRYASLPVDHPALLILSNSVGVSWSLCSDAWQPLVRECTQIACTDLSHLDLIQRQQEFRIVEHLQPGCRSSD